MPELRVQLALPWDMRAAATDRIEADGKSAVRID